MLDGIDLEDKENVASVTSVIKAVLDGVKVGHGESVRGVFFVCLFFLKMIFHGSDTIRVLFKQELVKLTIEKQEQPSPTTPNKPAPPASAPAEG